MIKPDEYMSSPVVTVEPHTTLDEMASLMDEKNIGCLVVTEHEKVVGIATERDILRKVLAHHKDPNEVQAKDIMTKEVFTVQKDATLMEVAALMKQHTFRRIIVMHEEKPVGIITSRDLIGLLV